MSVPHTRRMVLSEGRIELVEGWLSRDKLEVNEELGDLVMELAPDASSLAMLCYIKCEAHGKVVDCLVGQGKMEMAEQYCKKVGYVCDLLDAFIKVEAGSRGEGGEEQVSKKVELTNGQEEHLDTNGPDKNGLEEQRS